MVIITCTLVINIFFYITTKSSVYEPTDDVPSAQTVLIPGAAVYADGSISSIFRDRVDTAIQLYEANKVSKILVSGDNSTVTHNEVNPVRLYLIDKGIPDEDIFLDHAGFDTYSSMYRAREIFGVTSIIITTQSFHLPRAIFIAHTLGISAHGVNADVGVISWRNYFREAFANDKAILNILTNRKPKYLGEKIPITADGRLYP